MSTPPLLLASQSESRRRLLADAAVPFETVPAGVDEDAIKASLVAEGLNARDLADAVAEWKCRRPSMRHPDAFVLGCDQTLELDDGSLIDKVETREAAADLLARMSGRAHKLHSAAVIAQAEQAQWRQIESVTLQMRPLSAAFIDHYLDLDWEQCRWCVGCYRIEGPGAQLFSRISGSLFAVQGLPLLPLLDYLRVRSILPA
ncbi:MULTISPECIES: Maf family protein [unclassified Sphingobium]|uniref:Maf family protein n=1 Tax=unclassified Sphingobium TaxID=2611147 RepID=UPI00222593DE|nr:MULTISPECIES: nucleoside triphosphate pyrophosphatase [unclassified Sphingobium]MCW2396222.1 septum formation protein [Sphingobium sp. B8D3B]MCW2419738.1 septum formation protein [Sphingobium sp. B8D3C]